MKERLSTLKPWWDELGGFALLVAFIAGYDLRAKIGKKKTLSASIWALRDLSFIGRLTVYGLLGWVVVHLSRGGRKIEDLLL